MSIAPTGALPAALAVAANPNPVRPSASPSTATGAAGSRTPSPAGAAASKAATQFERVLLEQLTKQLAATAAPGDDASPATSAYRDMLPGTMADALSQAGGIGIAAQLTRSMGAGATTSTGPPAGVAGPPTTPTSGSPS